MGQRPNDAAVMDAQIKLKMEDCASGTGQSTKDAAVMDAQTTLEKEEYVGDMEHTATPMMNLQLLHHALGQNSRRLL